MNSPKKYLVSVFVLFTHLNFTENLKYPLNSDTQQELYEKSYNCLVSMLKGDTAINFKNAVFTVENTFLEGQLNYDTFNIAIEYYTDLARRFAEKSTLLYEGDDKKSIQILGAIFMIMTAEKPFFLDSGYYFIPDPFTYDFEDFWGEKDWT